MPSPRSDSSSSSPSVTSSRADLVLDEARVLTIDPRQPHAECVAIAAGEILAVGTRDEIRPFIGPHTRRFSCEWRTILPGCIDPHLHLFAWASRACGADLSGARSITDIRNALSARLSRTAGDGWLRGYGYDEFCLRKRRHPTRHDLDAVTADRPIIVRHRSGHAAVLNSLALSRVGITAHRGSRQGVIERDAHGEPTGIIYEMEAFLRKVLPRPDAAEFQTGLRAVSHELLRHGICAFHDAGANNTLRTVRQFSDLVEEGVLHSRPTVMLGMSGFSELTDAKREAGIGTANRVRIGSVKIMLHESGGHLDPPPDELAEMVWQVHRRGLQVAIHAVEEASVCVAIDAIQHAQSRLPRSDHRHRIEHCSLCPPTFLDSLAESGCAVVMQPGFIHFYGDEYLAEVGRDVHPWLYRTQSFFDRGIPVAAGSDCPVAPQNPWLAVHAAITRQTRSGAVVNPEEAVSLGKALALWTRAAAWMGFDEKQAGCLAPGLRADVLVLNCDVTRLAPEDLGNVAVDTTIIDGRPVYSA